MKHLTLENIAWYVPNDLKVFSEIHKRIDLVIGMVYTHTGKQLLDLKTDNNYSYTNGLESVKPILLPMSDLTKPFIKDGEETTHLQELAKIRFPHDKWKMKYSDYYKEYRCVSNRFDFSYSDYIGFNAHYLKNVDNNSQPGNQFELYKYLAREKFDFQNLITDGLAIDANTLETNPYL